MLRRTLIAASIALVVLALSGAVALAWLLYEPAPDPTLRVFTARMVRTLDAELPEATAIAVQRGRIRAVGSLEQVRAALRGKPFELDERFAGKVLLPGFVDPHIHPSLAATILPMEIVSAMEWATPQGRSRAVRGREPFLARLLELDGERTAAGDAEDWLLVWGYHAPYHGALSRSDLDAISQRRPILVWQRSVHEMYLNTRALEALELSEADFAASDEADQADWATGHVWEGAMFTLGAGAVKILTSPAGYRRGLGMMSEILHRGGLTTVGEQGFPQVTKLEWLMLRLEMRKRVPYRFALVPNAMFLARRNDTVAGAAAEANGLLRWSTESTPIVRHVKYYADGAIFSQLMQMTEPYLDGHHGEWMMPPEQQAEVLEAFWRSGFDIHVHVNGDAGLDLVLDQIEAVQGAHAAPGRRIVMEHYGFAREDQHARLARLGGAVSNNAYYLHELAPIYAEHGLGPERAANISPLGALARAGVPISFHSDFPMAPAEPLRLVWVAVNRIASDGHVWGEHQKLSLDRALRAITIEGAWSLGLEEEIGSIAVGKKADFTVLEQDPYEIDPRALADIPIWGTVLGGRPYAIEREPEPIERRNP